jgi:hypothetical protein
MNKTGFPCIPRAGFWFDSQFFLLSYGVTRFDRGSPRSIFFTLRLFHATLAVSFHFSTIGSFHKDNIQITSFTGIATQTTMDSTAASTAKPPSILRQPRFGGSDKEHPVLKYPKSSKSTSFVWGNISDSQKKSFLYKVAQHWKGLYGKLSAKDLVGNALKDVTTIGFRDVATWQQYVATDSVEEFSGAMKAFLMKREKRAEKKRKRTKEGQAKETMKILDGKKGAIQIKWFANSLSSKWYEYWLNKQVLNDDEAQAFLEVKHDGGHIAWKSLACRVFDRIYQEK